MYAKNDRIYKKSNSILRSCDNDQFEEKNIEESKTNQKFGQTETS